MTLVAKRPAPQRACWPHTPLNKAVVEALLETTLVRWHGCLRVRFRGLLPSPLAPMCARVRMW
jgi:hypothetical protein